MFLWVILMGICVIRGIDGKFRDFGGTCRWEYILYVMYVHTNIHIALFSPFRPMGLDTATAVEGYMPVAQPGAPKCPPFASLCECNKNYYYYESERAGTRARARTGARAARATTPTPLLSRALALSSSLALGDRSPVRAAANCLGCSPQLSRCASC